MKVIRTLDSDAWIGCLSFIPSFNRNSLNSKQFERGPPPNVHNYYYFPNKITIFVFHSVFELSLIKSREGYLSAVKLNLITNSSAECQRFIKCKSYLPTIIMDLGICIPAECWGLFVQMNFYQTLSVNKWRVGHLVDKYNTIWNAILFARHRRWYPECWWRN